VRLDQLLPADAERVFEYCQDPIFERYLHIPWPYRRSDADSFISGYIAAAWAADSEYIWAVRNPDTAELLGVIGLRLPSASIGYWLGAPHRGHGYIPEAQLLVIDWAFANRVVDTISWQCLEGNMASARTARKAGFSFTGVGPAIQAHRDGSYPASWHAVLRATDTREPKHGWPIEEPVG
jgi:RimJ/RimL family protein N-acetyltransferase